MHIRSLRAWMGTLSALTRLTLVGSLAMALACHKGNNDNNGPRITATGAPTVDTYAASPSVITVGQTSTLAWGVTSGSANDSTGMKWALPTTVTIDQGVGTVEFWGTFDVKPTVTTTYTLTASYPAGSIPGISGNYGAVSITSPITITVGPTVPGVLSIFAGTPMGGGNVDGPAAGALFSKPTDVTVDGDGNAYITDSTNNTIRKLSASGEVTTFAGIPGQSGFGDGPGLTATFNNPSSISVDGSGNLFVADTGNNTIRKITAAGVVSTIAGKARTLAGSVNGKGQIARFNSPFGLTVDSTGNVYVADSYNHTIRKLTPSLNTAGGTDYTASTFAGEPATSGSMDSTDGTGATARFLVPTGLAADGAGNLYVADYGNHIIRKITPTGLVTTLAGTATSSGSTDGNGAAARFNQPHKLAVDANGNVYVADLANHTIRMIAPDRTVSTLAGQAGMIGSADGMGSLARFNQPFGVATDALGQVLVADGGNKIIRRIDSGAVVSTIASTATPSGNLDATGSAARFQNPASLVVDGSGSIYVADFGNNSIRKISPTGAVSTFVSASAGMIGPEGLALDQDGSLYVAVRGDHTIRKITAGGVLSTLAGSAGNSGLVDGAGDVARFSEPTGVAVDATGNVYVADFGNHLIRKITPAGVVSTLAGNKGTSDGTSTGTPMGFPGNANGTGTSAGFYHPHALSVNAAGNVFVADMDNHAIRMITPAGEVSRLVGLQNSSGQSALGQTDDLNATASLYSPSSTALDGSGNIYVVDKGNNTIRKITTDATTGHVTTIVGVPGRVINTNGPLPATLNTPSWVAVDPTTGNLFLTVRGAILKVSF